LGVHLIDIIHFTLGSIEEVDCKNRIFFKDRTSVDEISECKFKLSNNTTGGLEVSRIFADMKEATIFEIYGTRGSIKMNCSNPYTVEIYSFENNSIEVKSLKSKKYAVDFYPGERSSLGFHQDCHMASIINFADELFSEKENTITPRIEDALKSQRVIEAAYLSDKVGKPVKVLDIV
jgi:predicted dehydrogenase